MSQAPTEAMEPCPFCGEALTPNTNQADFMVKQYGTHFSHPDNTCYLSGGEVSPAEVEDWNHRAARAQTPGEPAGWQPIETAPKDGTGMLALWVHADEPVTARNYALVEFVRGCWRDTESDDQVYTDPTHWMPLPAAPSVQPATPKGAQGSAMTDGEAT